MREDLLFSPVQIGGLTAKNRIMQLSTRTNLSRGTTVTDEFIAFYTERAKGGAGAIVVEPLNRPIPSRLGSTTFTRSNIGVCDAESVAGLARLASSVHSHGALIFGQLFHGGRQHHARNLPLLYGPSAIPCPYSGGVPHELSVQEIAELVAGFAAAARSLREAGFDGVEVHAAQGHLVQEFLSEFSNQRADEYGGSLENRGRLLRDIVRAVRDACGSDGTFAVGVRLATEERSPNGIDIKAACAVAADLTARVTVDYLSLSKGNFNSIELHIPDRSVPQLDSSPDAELMKATVPEIPVVTCGRIVTPENAERLLAQGHGDIIGLCRPLICDPQWPAKAKARRVDEIRHCISCNQCWDEITNGRPVRCVHNPVAGRERTWSTAPPARVTVPKRVVVVGGGPSGMEAARVAALKGHTVLLFDSEPELGGSVNFAGRVPGHGEIRYVRDHLAEAVQQAGVEVRLGPAARVSAERVLDEVPDAVILATGARQSRSTLGAPEDFPVYTVRDVVADRVPTGGRVVLFDEDGYYEPCETAEMIAHNGAELFFVTRFTEVARELPMASRITTLRMLDSLGVTLVPTSWYSRTQGRDVYLAHCYTGRERVITAVDSIVHVGYKQPATELLPALQAEVPEVYVIGDAYMPRRILDAVREGHEVGELV